MAQIKIHARRAFIDRHRQALSDAIHGVMMAALGLPEDKRFHRFIALDDADFIQPADRGDGYTVIEILMFEGRSDAAKRACLRGLMQAVPEAAGIPVEAVEITIIETPMANWGIRGKIGDELALNYKVQT
ncbi:tautomerase family protein [Thalassobaculum sp. OXR-137]|uniref:tautomerase family protein n=1 Tax=Thalassobaculum sp. OXR-137 TaxID=3100173 RepID=UPI002AC9B2EB|nr:tautomerase family protein [Thalassobaculum sp. OXR-137]WPZ33502.1 tautomerase family protein [Thalassobaculum sp. OXR-137]